MVVFFSIIYLQENTPGFIANSAGSGNYKPVINPHQL